MFYRKERDLAAMLSALMAQTKDSMVCFTFRQPVDPTEPQDVIDAKLRDATVLEASGPFAKYFGFSNREDIVGKHLLTLFDGEIPSWFVDYGQEVEDRNFEDIERIVKIPVGSSYRSMRVYMQNIFDGKFLISQWLTIKDISREEEQERIIEENERLQLLALEAVGLRTFSLALDAGNDAHGTISFGQDARPDWWTRIHPDDKTQIEAAFTDFANGKSELLHTQFRLLRSSGEDVWMESWGVARNRNEQGMPDGVVGVVMDRTQSKALEAHLMASQRLESLGVMAGGIAHDFNNLLLTITGSLDIILSRNPDLNEELRAVDDAARQASQLCEQLLTYAGRGSAELRNIDISNIIKDATELLGLNVHANVDLVFNLAPECWVRGDKSQLTQVLMNLVKNASDALEGERGTITVSSEVLPFDPDWRQAFPYGAEIREQPHVLLQVSDTGKGIVQGEAERLFDPFYTTKFTGRGLGLAVVMGAVRGHGGSIGVESVSGKGTSIRVLMPQASETEIAVVESTEQPVNLSGCVLVVDDEQTVRDIAVRLLQTIGLESVSVDSGQGAIDLIATEPERFDAVLLDVSMPGLDGVETANRILESQPETRILMCSGYSTVTVPDKLSETVEFLQKPYRLDQLREKLAPMLT